MPGYDLTRAEAQERAGIVSNVQYRVHIDLTKGASTFPSVTDIEFDATDGASTFVDLIAHSVTAVTLNGRTLDPAQVYGDCRVQLDGLQAHNTVHIEALCDYSHTGEGLHRSVDPTDGNVYMYTQFEVMDARRMFAAFDQPDIKAVFQFTADAPKSWTVINTMPGKHQPLEGSTTAESTLTGGKSEPVERWTFEKTPKMSSYLTALIAGPYASWHTTYANEDGRTVPMGLYCRQSLKAGMDKDADYLFKVTKGGFAFYARTWGVPYPYAKYDQIFVPEYNAGAMENIGTVTVRDSYVFQSHVTDALSDRRDETILHELAHMWFGDLVTMKWWNDLWLNESFAEFMSTLCTAETTQWKTEWSTFSSGEKSWGMSQDQLPTTHPVVAEIKDINDTEVNFDGITYAKGGSILKQLMAYVGRDKFFQGIHNYLTKHAYGNATLHDLLVELAATSGRDLDQWAQKWLQTAGVNTLTTEVSTDEKGVITAFAIRQSADIEHPVLRPHRMKIGFYNWDDSKKAVVRSSQIELDVDGPITKVPQLVGKARPDFILTNDDDLTYAKLRFDAQSREFLLKHLADFEDPLARSVCWLSLWDMTRDAQLPASDFLAAALDLAGREDQSTTLRTALGTILTTVRHYTAPSNRAYEIEQTADRLWTLAHDAQPGSDRQFQLFGSWLALGAGSTFADRTNALLRSEDSAAQTMPGLQIDNNMRWSILTAQARRGLIGDDEIKQALAQDDTTTNRQFALGAQASKPTPETKAWAWDQALHNADLTNDQMDEIANGFSSNDDPALYEPYVEKYYSIVNWVWKNKSFHMAENLLHPLRGDGLYPVYADPAKLVDAGTTWLDNNADAPRALRRMILENTDRSRRMLKVSAFNAAQA